MSPTPPQVIQDLISTLEQGLALICELSPEHYSKHPEHIQASSIGAHYRHHIEHAQLLLAGWQEGVVDYDRRERDTEVEQHIDVAIARTHALIKKLEDLSEAQLDTDIEIAHHTSIDSPPVIARTTLRRELLFLVSHAVHHYALMKVIVESLGHQPCDSFGVMPSTLIHQKNCAED